LKQVIKKVLESVAPAYLQKRIDDHNHQFEEKEGLYRIQNAFIAKHGCVVQSGPFTGMRYITEATGSVLTPKLVGSYEAELHALILQLAARKPSVVVDVGSAEGYYAVGMARLLPEAMVYAYDTNPHAQQLCQALARENAKQESVVVRGECNAAELEKVLKPGSLLICDCEGYEKVLINPEASPQLSDTDVLVEFHDHLNSSVSPTVLSNMQKTHDFVKVKSVGRLVGDYNTVESLPDEDRAKAINEYRPSGQFWGVFTPKSRPL
jgi:predicted O-methyltransferase YrrM